MLNLVCNKTINMVIYKGQGSYQQKETTLSCIRKMQDKENLAKNKEIITKKKIAISKAKLEAFQEVFDKPNSKEGEKDI